MSQREEFEAWYRRSCSDVYLHHTNAEYIKACMETSWVAARASRWRSMESAPDIEILCIENERERGRYIVVEYEGKWRDGCRTINPLAWHPLPDPPTKEELEKLK